MTAKQVSTMYMSWLNELSHISLSFIHNCIFQQLVDRNHKHNCIMIFHPYYIILSKMPEPVVMKYVVDMEYVRRLQTVNT